MVSYIFSQQVINSFWLPFLAGFIIFILQLITSKRNDRKTVSPYTFHQVNQQVKQITYVNNYSSSHRPRRNNNKNDAGGFAALIFMAGGFYQVYEQQVLQVMFGLTVFVFALWFMTVVHAFLCDIIHGIEWQVFLIFSLIFVAISLYLIYVAQNPIYNVDSSSQVGLAQLSKLMEAAYKVLGILFFFGGLLCILATLIYYITSINISYKGETSKLSEWILKITRRFSNPIHIGLFLIVIFSISYAFVSGFIYHLITS